MRKKILVEKINTLHGHKDCIYTIEKGIESPYFYSSGGDGLVARWDLQNPEVGDLIVKVPNSVYALACLPAQKQLIVGQNFEGLHLIDLESNQEIKSIKLTSAAIFDIQVVDNTILVACGDGVVIIVDLEAFAVRKHIKASDKSARCLSINVPTQEFAVGYSDHFIRIFDLNTGQLKHTFEAHQNSVFTIQYAPKGDFLLSGSRDAHIKVWNVQEQYNLHQSIVAHLFAINHMIYSPDGQYFATCSMDKSVKVWDAQTFTLLKVIDKARHAGHGTSINKLLWVEYENLLISGSDDRTLSLWKLNFLEEN
jgi:WD40 repeat protein